MLLISCCTDPGIVLMHPRRECRLDSVTKQRVASHLATNFDISSSSARHLLPAKAIEWGKFRLGDNTIAHAHGIVQYTKENGGRDATFVKVCARSELMSTQPFYSAWTDSATGARTDL